MPVAKTITPGDSSGFRICSACGQEKLCSDFYWTTRRNGERARHSKCRPCRKSQFKAWRETTQGREWKRIQTYNIYGIDLAVYASMLEGQGGACAICRNLETKKRNGRTVLLAVDHDHATGEVRGLLCHKCNSGLGAFRDNRALVALALAYLERSAAVQ